MRGERWKGEGRQGRRVERELEGDRVGEWRERWRETGEMG